MLYMSPWRGNWYREFVSLCLWFSGDFPKQNVSPAVSLVRLMERLPVLRLYDLKHGLRHRVSIGAHSFSSCCAERWILMVINNCSALLRHQDQGCHRRMTDDDWMMTREQTKGEESPVLYSQEHSSPTPGYWTAWGTQSRYPMWIQHNYLSCCCCLPMRHSSSKQVTEARWNPGVRMWNMSSLTGILTSVPNACSFL